MRIIDLLEPGRVLADLQASGKRAVLEELVGTMAPGPEGLDLQAVVEILLERERLGSTGIGDHIAIPHGKLPNLPTMKLAFGRSLLGVDFASMDGKPSHLFFLLLAPENSAGLHLKALAKISRMLLSQSFRDSLMQADSAGAIFRLLAERDAEL
ncbi:MAG: PTS sugar transporter subunit IIA [Deltaproteobacteria bacterium]|nr:PTS sugar transporter subunit IIA [Deltaproteobacteria bacterium]